MIGDAGVGELAKALASNHTLTDVCFEHHLTYRVVHVVAIVMDIARMACPRCVAQLYLGNYTISSVGAFMLRKALTANRTLTTVCCFACVGAAVGGMVAASGHAVADVGRIFLSPALPYRAVLFLSKAKFTVWDGNYPLRSLSRLHNSHLRTKDRTTFRLARNKDLPARKQRLSWPDAPICTETFSAKHTRTPLTTGYNPRSVLFLL